MNVNLTPALERLVQDKVKSGRYHSVTEVLGEALRLLEERDQSCEIRRRELRTKIAEGLESLRRGEGVDGEEVFGRLEAELEALEPPKSG